MTPVRLFTDRELEAAPADVAALAAAWIRLEDAGYRRMTAAFATTAAQCFAVLRHADEAPTEDAIDAAVLTLAYVAGQIHGPKDGTG
jgi:fructose-bisphosphate aldolase class 1